MLSEVRHQKIINIVNDKANITVEELTELLNASESTIRRDLNYLAKKGKLYKVHGGAMVIEETRNSKDESITTRYQINMKEKKHIGKYAALLIDDNDFVYIDAGTTTECMIDYLECKNATFVTNGILQAQKLLNKGYQVFLLGGQLKPTTEAIIGELAIFSLQNYHFTKGFFGANGVDIIAGYTTPEVNEAAIKREAMKHSQDCYVLVDCSKFDKKAAIMFERIEAATIITNTGKSNHSTYKEKTNIIEVEI